MTDNKDDLTLAERREFALEQTARDLGISVGELKRQLAHEVIMTDERITALQDEIAKLKSSQPTPIDRAAESAWRDRMHAISEDRALRDAKSFFSRSELAAMQAAAPDDQVKAIAMRDSRAPTGPSSAGIVPTSQQVSNVRVGGGSGWARQVPIKNGLGQGK